MRCELVAGCIGIVVGMGYASDRQPVSFSQRYALNVSSSGAYFRLTLPQQIYAASKRSDLGDLRVFNGAGELLPFSLEQSKPVPVRRVVLKPTVWFPVPAEEAVGDKTHLGVSVGTDGTLRAEVAAIPGTKRNGEVDLVDLGKDSAVVALWVRLHDERYQGRIHVEASDDLNQWQAVADVALLKVSADGKQLAQERVALDGVRQRYLKLSWPDGKPEIGAVETESSILDAAADAQSTVLLWRAAAQLRAGTVAGEYLFESDGAYPVESLRISLPQSNTIARVTIQNRSDSKSPWRDVASGKVFRLQGKNGEQVSSSLQFDAITRRYWRMLVDMRNGGIGGGMPQLSLGWRPAVLTFVARGSPPFTLGVGNAMLTSNALDKDSLLVGEHPEIRDASLGTLLSTVADKQTDASSNTTRHTVLWLSLIAAVVALGVIAWRLVRVSSSEG